MKRISTLLLFFIIALQVNAQLYKLKSSQIKFFSEAIVEDITAVNEAATGLLEASKGELAISIPMNKFQFENSLMQEHFNEKYLETDKFPKATYAAIIKNFSNVGSNEKLTSTGIMKIHGKEKEYITTGIVTKTTSGYDIEAEFDVKLEDHKIKIPRLMWKNIAEVVKVTVVLHFEANE